MALCVCLLLSAFLVLTSTAPHLCGAQVVLDVNGAAVASGSEYYLQYAGMMPDAIDNYDLVPATINGTSYVAVVPKVFTDGSRNVPVRVQPVIPGNLLVNERFKMSFSTGDSTGDWTLTTLSNGKKLLATTGVGSSFKVEPSGYDDGYLLMACPCTLCVCNLEVGRVAENDMTFLGDGFLAYTFKFVKKTSGYSSQ